MNTTFTSNRFKQLAGIIKEQTEDLEVSKLEQDTKKLLNYWLEDGGKEKIEDHLVEKVDNFFENEDNIIDDEGHFVKPDADYFCDGQELLETFIDDIAVNSPRELQHVLIGGEVDDKVLEILQNGLENAALELCDLVIEGTIDAYADAADYAKDPQAYVGVSQKDFL